jgi:hypothetical protein
MKEAFRIIRLFGELTNPFKIISGAVIAGILTVIIAIILVVLLRKFILVPRRYPVLKFIAWSYFLILPLLAGFFGFKWGLFNSLRKDIREHSEVYVKHIPSSFDISTKELFEQPMTTNQMIDSLSEIVYRQYYQTLGKQSLVIRISGGKGVAYFTKRAIHKLLKDKLGLEEGVSKDLMDEKINEVLRTGLFAKIALIQMDHFLQGVQKGILITFFLIIAIPVIEILIAHYLHKKKMRTDGKL